eukprot:151812_1
MSDFEDDIGEVPEPDVDTGGAGEVVFRDDNLQLDDEQGVRSAVHLRVQQRNGRKCLTTVQGLAEDLDLKKILKYLKKIYNTNGTIVADAEVGDVVQMQGDQRQNIQQFLVEFKVCKGEEIKIHGF